MSKEIVGTLKIDHGVDPSGSLICTIPVRVPSAKMAPDISLAYHSAANSASAIGMGWAIKGVSYVERVQATIAQDGYRGAHSLVGETPILAQSFPVGCRCHQLRQQGLFLFERPAAYEHRR